jgi:hypothetical protein
VGCGPFRLEVLVGIIDKFGKGDPLWPRLPETFSKIPIGSVVFLVAIAYLNSFVILRLLSS